MSISIESLLRIKEDFTVTWIVKDQESKELLEKGFTQAGGHPGLYRIFIEPRIELEEGMIGYRLEAPAFLASSTKG